MKKIRALLGFVRIHQWYKNIVVFLPLVFALHLFLPKEFFITMLGFVSLCLVSSSTYVRNDILDLERDKVHSIKRNRSLPSGLFTVNQAWVLFVVLISIGLALSFVMSWKFTIMLVLLFVNTEIYSRWTKNIIFLDAFSIAANFIIRAISGIILIGSKLSPWLILGIFFVALFLGYTKRKAEVESLNEDAGIHRKVLKEYTPFSINSVVVISAMMIIMTYSLYAIDGQSHDWRLVLTVPMVIFVIFRQLHLVSIKDTIAQTNEVFRDKQSGIGILVFLVVTIYLMYFAPAQFFK
ncbi:MAG TPA: UbiA prenyltransferase family protein [Verrucomicrobiae bacterium]|nr:UbiA prenyltransferase family protein [Verrucomicrobiae bacterium]